ncbi:CGLD27 family protein [Prochlorococcus sp. MIT 1307]|uniref:CGLD27 family protein n=1 Tax=Prochlorococcus sp. MIT 1307 TaxID=3096219 RepID=UPI002A75E116|nr:CGLD27 family protein [Prochlorococcus sp. MIT 1307]
MSQENIYCPVPRAQIPIEEFVEMSKSWFFSWPINNDSHFNRKLFISWMLVLPINLILGTGSLQLRSDIPKLLALSSLASLVFPLILLIRLWLSWQYILKRLYSEKIEYEKSGWYDGAKWDKPIEWRQRDLLIARHDVMPIIHEINQSIIVIISIIVSGLMIYYLYNKLL